MPLPIPRPYKGVIPPLVTPLTARDEIDKEGLARIIDRMVAAGVRGVFALGTTGEAPALSLAARRAMIAETCKLVRNRVPVLVGVSDCSVAEALALAQYAAEAGASGVVFACPFYFPMNGEGLLRWSVAFAEATPLPFFLYNIPSHTRNSFPLETVRAIAPHPMCIGMKDSSGDWDYFAALLEMARDFPDYTVLIGPEERLARALDMGAHGGVTGGGNLAPALFTDIWKAMRDNQRATAYALQETSQFLCREIYAEGYIPGLKCALELAGICSGRLTEGLVPIEGEARERIRRALDALPL
jgi:4-hydroxy-tetrahydrodipicolinate synthase